MMMCSYVVYRSIGVGVSIGDGKSGERRGHVDLLYFPRSEGNWENLKKGKAYVVSIKFCIPSVAHCGARIECSRDGSIRNL